MISSLFCCPYLSVLLVCWLLFYLFMVLSSLLRVCLLLKGGSYAWFYCNFLFSVKSLITSSILLIYSRFYLFYFTYALSKSWTSGGKCFYSLKKLLGSLFMELGVLAKCSSLIEGPSLIFYSWKLISFLLLILLNLELFILSGSFKTSKIFSASSIIGTSPQISPKIIAWLSPTEKPRIVFVGSTTNYGVIWFNPLFSDENLCE